VSDILRRGRLASVPDEEIINFTSSMNADKWIFKADILVDLAHTIMLKERKIIKAEDCKKILEGLLYGRGRYRWQNAFRSLTK